MGYRFVFWQNINSIHQSAFLKALAKRHEVTLVTTEPESGRAHMGWEEPLLPNVEVLRFDDIDWKGLIQSHRRESDWHVFAGLQAFRKVHAAFLHALSSDCRTGLYAEPLRMDGLTGWLKRVRGTIDSRRFGARVGFVLCIGSESRRQFLHWGFPRRKLHKWAYVTEDPAFIAPAERLKEGIRAVFPASFIHRKGADILVEAVGLLKYAERLRIDAYSIEKGNTTAWQERLIEKAHAGGVLRIHPFIGNRSLVGELAASDFTILPSRFDGWGAVVNESLSLGTPVIVSRHSGASELLESRYWLGRVLEDLGPAKLAQAIDETVLAGPVDAELRDRISGWARSHISGECLCEYFLDIVAMTDEGTGYIGRAPWEAVVSNASNPKADS
jgi:glycosyltransferase involved in cell wall biosynthesis